MAKTRSRNSKSNASNSKHSKSTQSTKNGTMHSATPTRNTTVETKPMPRHITAQAIGEAAYFLWQQRGGNEVVNWLEAEAMLKNGTMPVKA